MAAIKTKPASAKPAVTAAQQLAGFFKKYDPKIAAFGRAVRRRFRALMPAAHELVYDNYNGLVLGFGPSARPSEAILSIVLFPRWVTICFLDGAVMDDPQKRLQGGGNQVRHIRLSSARDLDDPIVRGLIDQAIRISDPPLPKRGRATLTIRSISAKQRPRRA